MSSLEVKLSFSDNKKIDKICDKLAPLNYIYYIGGGGQIFLSSPRKNGQFKKFGATLERFWSDFGVIVSKSMLIYSYI